MRSLRARNQGKNQEVSKTATIEKVDLEPAKAKDLIDKPHGCYDN
jgi:hypothetical protein